jgi:hypothetical protein
MCKQENENRYGFILLRGYYLGNMFYALVSQDVRPPVETRLLWLLGPRVYI